ncbi:hypothetical protein F2Q69_00012473 [Brassica cretica]|uniref:Uncharacterized protein n=1 Tax=Brassica cretica TaxID=69181 RepID=A0A8S9QYM4_BRACR|nr:hypothetical protein F2Q69_00012473 [Brassica cretica]
MMESSFAKNYYDFASNMSNVAHELINRKTILCDKIFFYQSIILSKYRVSNHYISPMGIHPDCPFAHLYRIENAYMPEEVFHFLCGKLRKLAKATSLPFKKLKGQGSFNHFFNPHTIYFFHHHVQVNNKTGKIHALPTLVHHNGYQRGVRPDFNINDNKTYEDFQTHAFRLNSAKQTFPIPFRPNWTYYPIDYQMSLGEDLQFFMEKQTQPPVVPKVSKIVKQEP